MQLILYSEDHMTAFFDNYKFKKDKNTGYYLSSKLINGISTHTPTRGVTQTNTRLQSTVKSIGVESIEFDGIEDVYNMEVADNHNFAVNGGLIVHNCMDNIRYFVATTGLAKEKTQYQAIL